MITKLAILPLGLAALILSACGGSGAAVKASAPPVAANTAPPAVVKASPSPAAPGFGQGQKIVGKDLEPGTYRSKSGDSCYWARLKGFGGTAGEIIASNIGSGPAVVTIEKDDVGFTSNRCGQWSNDLVSITKGPSEPFGNGTFIVGTDIAPGRWRAENTDSCFYSRLHGFTGSPTEIISSDIGSGSVVVDIAATDKGFTSSRCGTWTKLG